MPKCHKIYPNCICQVPTEWHTLGFYSALLTKVYWNHATHIVRVCVTPISPKTSKLDLTDKSNLQVHFGSKAMASLYDLLCYHSLTSTDPLLEELLSYLPTRFHSHIFDYIAYEHSSEKNQFIQLIHLFLHSTLMIRPTFLRYFIPYLLYFFYATPKLLPRGRAQDGKEGPAAEIDRRPRRRPGGPELLENRRSWPANPVVQGARTLSTPRTTGATANG